MSLRGGIPLVPAKLGKRIQEGSFIEMAELLPELLRNISLPDDINRAPLSWQYHGMGMMLQLLYH